MNKKMVKAIAFIICLAMVITSFSFVFFLPSVFAETENEDTTSREYLNSRMVFMRNYFEFLEKNFKDGVDYKDLTQAAMEGATASLGDPYSEFYVTEEAKETFENTVSGQYAGIGVTIQKDGEQKKIVSVNVTGPAYREGVEAGDIILKVDGKNAVGMTLDEISVALKGEEGTSVTLVVERNGQQKSFNITREIISVSSISYELIDGNIGYMKIDRIDSDTSTEFKLAKIELVNKGADKLLLDLRDNPGGFMDQAIDMADQMLPEGAVITHYIKKGEVLETHKATGKRTSEIPIVVLINENSASASEILAGALQDNDAAKLVGTTSFGKGIAQQVVGFATGEGAKISVFYFVTPDKKDINKVGITPDYVVKNVSFNNDEYIESYNSFAPMSENEKPSVGDTGLNVYGAQQRLKFLGYYTGSVTGTMDADTGAALKKFQKDEGLYPYATLDNTTRSRLAAAAYNKAYGINAGQDLQMEKAIEILKTMK